MRKGAGGRGECFSLPGPLAQAGMGRALGPRVIGPRKPTVFNAVRRVHA